MQDESSSILKVDDKLETVVQVSQDGNLVSQSHSKDYVSDQQTQVGIISAKINTEVRANNGLNDEIASQPPNS